MTVVGDEELCLSGDQKELVLWWSGSYFLGNQVFLAQERFLGYFWPLIPKNVLKITDLRSKTGKFSKTGNFRKIEILPEIVLVPAN